MIVLVAASGFLQQIAHLTRSVSSCLSALAGVHLVLRHEPFSCVQVRDLTCLRIHSIAQEGEAELEPERF